MQFCSSSRTAITGLFCFVPNDKTSLSLLQDSVESARSCRWGMRAGFSTVFFVGAFSVVCVFGDSRMGRSSALETRGLFEKLSVPELRTVLVQLAPAVGFSFLVVLSRSEESCPDVGALRQQTLEDGVLLFIPRRFSLQPERLDIELDLKWGVNFCRNYRFLALCQLYSKGNASGLGYSALGWEKYLSTCLI